MAGGETPEDAAWKSYICTYMECGRKLHSESAFKDHVQLVHDLAWSEYNSYYHRPQRQKSRPTYDNSSSTRSYQERKKNFHFKDITTPDDVAADLSSRKSAVSSCTLVRSQSFSTREEPAVGMWQNGQCGHGLVGTPHVQQSQKVLSPGKSKQLASQAIRSNKRMEIIPKKVPGLGSCRQDFVGNNVGVNKYCRPAHYIHFDKANQSPEVVNSAAGHICCNRQWENRLVDEKEEKKDTDQCRLDANKSSTRCTDPCGQQQSMHNDVSIVIKSSLSETSLPQGPEIVANKSAKGAAVSTGMNEHTQKQPSLQVGTNCLSSDHRKDDLMDEHTAYKDDPESLPLNLSTKETTSNLSHTNHKLLSGSPFGKKLPPFGSCMNEEKQVNNQQRESVQEPLKSMQLPMNIVKNLPSISGRQLPTQTDSCDSVEESGHQHPQKVCRGIVNISNDGEWNQDIRTQVPTCPDVRNVGHTAVEMQTGNENQALQLKSENRALHKNNLPENRVSEAHANEVNNLKVQNTSSSGKSRSRPCNMNRSIRQVHVMKDKHRVCRKFHPQGKHSGGKPVPLWKQQPGITLAKKYRYHFKEMKRVMKKNQKHIPRKRKAVPAKTSKMKTLERIKVTTESQKHRAKVGSKVEEVACSAGKRPVSSTLSGFPFSEQFARYKEERLKQDLNGLNTDGTVYNFLCKECRVSFVQRCRYVQHVLHQHQLFQCLLCQKSCANGSHLYRFKETLWCHLEAVHEVTDAEEMKKYLSSCYVDNRYLGTPLIVNTSDILHITDSKIYLATNSVISYSIVKDAQVDAPDGSVQLVLGDIFTRQTLAAKRQDKEVSSRLASETAETGSVQGQSASPDQGSMATMSSSAKDEVPSPSSKEDSNKTRQLDGDVKLTCHHADVTKTKGVCGQTSLRNSRDSSEDGITSAAEAMKHNPPASEPHHEGEGASKSSTPSNAKHSTDQSGRPKHRGVNEVNGQVDNGVSSDEENPLIIAMDEETKDPLDDKRVQTEQQQPKIMNPKKKILSEYVEGKNRAVNSNDFKSKTGADGDTIRHSSSCGDIAGQANVIDERPQTVPPPLAQIHRVSDRLNQLPGKQEKSGPHSPDQRLSINLQSCINHVLDSAAIRNKLSDSPEPHSPPEGISFETKGGESQKQKDRDAGGDVKLTQTSTDTEKYQEDGSDFHTSGQRLVNGSKAFAWHGYQDHGQTKKPTESSLWAQRQSTENRLVSPLHGNMAKNMVQDSPRRGTYNCGKPGDNQNVSVSSQMYQKQHYDSCSVGPPASTVTSCSFSLFGATTMTKQLAPMPGSVAATMRSSMPMAQSSRLPLDISSSRQDISQKRGSDGSVSQPKRHMGYYPGVGEMSTPYGAQTSAADYGRNQERFAVSSSSHGGVHRPSAFRYTTNVGIPTTVRPHAPPPTAPISAPLQQTAPGWSRTTPGPLASPAGVHRSIAGQPPLTRPHHGGIRGPCPNHHSTNQPGANPVHTVQRPAQQAPLPRLANQQWPLGSITHGSPLPQCQTYPERGGYGPRMPVPQRQTRIESRGQQQQHTGKAAAYPPTDAWRHNIAQGSCKIVSGLPSYQQISGHLSHQQRQQGAAGDNQSGVVRQGPPPLILARSLPEIHCRDEPHADIPRPSTQAGEPSYRSTGRDAPLDLSAASKCKPEEARPKNVDTKPSTTDADQPLDLSVKVPRPFEGSKDNPRSLASSYDGPRGVNVDSNQFQSKISLASSPSMYSLKQSSSAKAGNVALSCGLPPQQQVIDRQPSPTQGKTSGSTLYSNTLHYVPGQKHVYGAQATQPTLVPAPGSQTRSSIPKAEAAQPMVDYQLGISGGVMQPAAENKCSLQQGLLQPQDDDSSLAGTRPGRKRSRGYLIGSHPVEDILFLRCSVCGHTYGSIHSFRRHFLKHHGFEPKTENVTIQSISATKHAVNEAIHVNGTVMGKQELLQSLHLLPKCKEGDSPPRPYIGGYDDVINEKHVYLTGTNPQTPKAAYKNECNQDNKSCKSGASGVMSQQGQNTKDTRNATNALDAYKQKILTSSNSTSSVYEFHSHPCLACYQRCVEHYGPSGVAVVCPAIQGSKRVHYSRDTYGWVICEQCRYRVPKTCSQQACMNSLKQRDHQATSGSCIYSVDRSGMVGITGTAEDKKPVLAALDQSNQTDKNVFSAKHVCQDLSCRESDCKAYLLDLKKGHVDQNEKIKIDTPTFLKEEKPLELCAKKKCRTSESCAESNELPPSDPESQLDEKKLMKGTESGVDVGAEEDGSQITACQALRNAKSVFEFLQKSVETAIALDTMSEEEAKERPDKHERTKGKTGSELESHVKPDITNMTCNDTKNLPGDRRIKEEAVMKHCMVSPATNSIIKTEETEPLDCAQRKSENILSLTFSELVEGAFRSYEKEQQLHASIPSKTDPPKQTAPINPEFLMERFNKMCEKMTEEKPSGGETPRNTTDLQMTLCHSPRVQNIEDCDTESVTFRKCISIGETINKAINRCFNIPIEKISLPGLRTKSSCDSSEQVKQNLGTENANEPEANASASGQISQASGAAERTLTTCPKQDESLQKSDNISENKVAGTDEMIDDDISLKVWKKGRRKYANMQLLKKKAEGCNAKEGEQMKESVVQRSCSDQSVLDGSERKDADERQRDVYEHTSQSGTEAIKETDEAKGSGKKRADAGGKRKARAELGTETPPKAAKSSASEVPPQEVTIAPRRRGRPPLKAEHSAASRGEEKEKSAGSRGRTRGRTRGRRCDIQKTFMLRNRRGHKV